MKYTLKQAVDEATKMELEAQRIGEMAGGAAGGVAGGVGGYQLGRVLSKVAPRMPGGVGKGLGTLVGATAGGLAGGSALGGAAREQTSQMAKRLKSDKILEKQVQSNPQLSQEMFSQGSSPEAPAPADHLATPRPLYPASYTNGIAP